MAKEVIVLVQHRYQQADGAWSNMGRLLKGYNKNTFPSRAKALTGLKAYLQDWNGKKVYDANGERRERHCTGADIVGTPQSDYNMRVVAWKVKEREVSPWKEVELKA